MVMVTGVVLLVFSILGVAFMLWVMVALEFQIHRDHANRDLALHSMRRT